ncbi:hypothetical protein FI667_g4793, partial [Globisporangium splendens]
MKSMVGGDDNSSKRKLSVTAQASTASASATTGANMESYNYSDTGGRSKLQLQCSDGRVFDVTHEEAMMSSTLWMLLQGIALWIRTDTEYVADKKAKTMVKQHMIPIFDVPSHSVELALFYCRCGVDLLCFVAVASHLDIQPLVDLTCRSIAQIMSATEAAHEIRQKFGLDDASAAASMECSCELRSGMSGFDFDMFNSLDHDLSTEEYELVEFDQPSVDDLVSFINGGSSSRGPPSSSSRVHVQGKNCHVHATPVSGTAPENNGDASAAAKKKNKKKKKKKKATCTTTTASGASAATEAPSSNAETTSNVAAHKTQAEKQKQGSSSPEKDDKEDDSDSSDSLEDDSTSICLPRDLHEKMRLARQNPSAIFQESQFEDDEEMEEQIESFRLALESAHLEYNSSKVKAKPRVTFAPQDVFRSTLVASQRHSSQRVSAAI